jgi:hypothetical protein
MIEETKTCYFKTYKHWNLKLQDRSSISAQTHTCDFQRFHINLFLRIFLLLKKSWEKWNGATYKCVSFQLGPFLDIFPCEKIEISIERSSNSFFEKIYYVSRKIKHEKDVGWESIVTLGRFVIVIMN